MLTHPQLLNTPAKEKWQKVGIQKRAGLLVPLFSVYSKNSAGIGDFQDLKLLVDFCRQSGNSLLQLLPMNEVGPLFCPYDALSSFALEPMYIHLQALGGRLNQRFPVGNTNLDYGIKKEKLKALQEVYQRAKDKDSAALQRFKEENYYWLRDFVFFKVLKYHHQGRAWWDWEEKFKNHDRLALEEFHKNHQEEINFQVWLQWVAFGQFKDAAAYAQSQKVFLKGDLPILVSRDSSDVWAHPEFFKLQFSAGAPPDMYCAKGQRWGMPTYNWERIAEDNYRYLKEKLAFAGNFYDLLRIDHVVGVFRIWSIPYEEPLENQGLNGFFDPRDDSQWEGQGRKILSIILKSTQMLVCAEDLGVVPKVCPKTLQDFGIPGNDVQRWTKDWKVKHDFLPAKDYRYLSVAMLSTHDTTNWPAWWENEAGTVDEGLFQRRCAERGIDYLRVKEKLFDPQRSCHGRLRWQEEITSLDKLVEILAKPREQLKDFIDFYENSYREKERLWRHLKLSGQMREKSDAEIVRAALKTTLEARAIFCIQTLLDWLFLTDIFQGDPYAYRINTPGTISAKNWSLTIPLSLEELLKHKVCREIKEMISASGRD